MPEETKESPYQEGNLQIVRLHSIQQQINLLNLNLREGDEDIGDYKYMLKFNCLNTLFSEVAPRISRSEKKQILKYIKAINDFLKTNKPHREGSVRGSYNVIKKEIIFYPSDFETLKNILFEFELQIKNLISKYFRSSLDEEKPKEW